VQFSSLGFVGEEIAEYFDLSCARLEGLAALDLVLKAMIRLVIKPLNVDQTALAKLFP
jgi:hypothetical protein